MFWIIVIIAAVVICFLLKFGIDYAKECHALNARGGVREIYRPIIDGLLEYSSAYLIKENSDFVVIGGSFTDPIFNRNCGQWSISIQSAFVILRITYQAYTDLGGGENSKKVWEFPSSADQEEILKLIRTKADEWDIYGIVK